MSSNVGGNSGRATRRGLAAGLALVALVLGYGDLVRGGITFGPLLLVLAYCVFIPLAIAAGAGGASGRSDADADAPPYRAAGVAAVAIFALYLVTLSPSTAMWDASEYIAAAYTMGLPHPPGNPLFVLIGRVFAILPIAPGVAMRINILAALASAVALGFWFLIADRVASRWLPGAWPRRIAGALAVLIGGTAFTVWHQSVVNEKVYTVSLAGIAAISWLTIRWIDTPDRARGDRYLVLIGYLLGLGYANHMAGMLPLPAVGLTILLLRPRTLLRWRLLAACVVALALGATPFATQPIRSAFNPPINEGEPTACRTGLTWSCTFSKGTWDAFSFNLNRGQYGKPALTERQAPFTAQLEMWWLYFRWQWVRDVHLERQPAQAAVALAFLLLGLAGAQVHFRRDRRSFVYIGPLLLLMSVGLVWYLNFRYGASQRPELAVPREVRDRDYFFLWSYSAWGIWVSLGLMQVWATLGRLLNDAGAGRWRPHLARAAALSVFGVALVPMIANWSSASRRDDATTIAFARDLLNSVEPYGVLVTGGDNDTFPLWYAQEVEGVRRDVTVAVLSLMNTDWFARGIIRRPVVEYDATRGPAVYRGQSWPKPDGPPLNLTLTEADSLPPYVIVTEPLRFKQKGLDLTIDPRRLPQVAGGGLLERADLLVLRMIADSWPERPLYISRTTGDYAERMGFADHVLSQGLARKIVLAPASASPETVYVDGSGWLDVERSRALWMQEMTGPQAIVRRGDWVDRPSLSTPYAYLIAGSELAEAMRARRDLSGARQVYDTVTRVAKAVRLYSAEAGPLEPGGGDAPSR